MLSWSKTSRVFVAFVLSLVLPGAGSYYLGRRRTALAALALATLGSLLAAAAWNDGVFGATALVICTFLTTLSAHLGGALCAAFEAARDEVKRGFGMTVAFMVCGALSLLAMQNVSRTHIMAVYTVTTIAMEPGLHFGDRVLAKPVAASAPLQRGELLAVRDPNTQQAYVRRLIGLPGDHVRISNTEVFVNDRALRVAACTTSTTDCFVEQSSDGMRYSIVDAMTPGEVNLEVTVPAGKVFVMRDRRDLSIPLDPVDRTWVQGQVMDVWWSYNGQHVDLSRVGVRVGPRRGHIEKTHE